MNKKKALKIVSILVVSIFLLSAFPEIRFIGLFIDLIGFEVFFLLVSLQLKASLTLVWKYTADHTFIRLHRFLLSADGYYFIPSYSHLKQCPALFLHAIPFSLVVVFAIAGFASV